MATAYFAGLQEAVKVVDGDRRVARDDETALVNEDRSTSDAVRRKRNRKGAIRDPRLS
jgi:hypothetical protein